ncbi:protein of unknown function [Shewanella benthica]|uniref:Uncharacterized protein n=1 Tax=Shewanella benthica TaxID=43661 RepID=A0A330M651_9GAMM|nr:protein of unknown function [Shewanella benthica]
MISASPGSNPGTPAIFTSTQDEKLEREFDSCYIYRIGDFLISKHLNQDVKLMQCGSGGVEVRHARFISQTIILIRM